jgi:hypothetical protein
MLTTTNNNNNNILNNNNNILVVIDNTRIEHEFISVVNNVEYEVGDIEENDIQIYEDVCYDSNKIVESNNIVQISENRTETVFNDTILEDVTDQFIKFINEDEDVNECYLQYFLIQYLIVECNYIVVYTDTTNKLRIGVIYK